MDKVFHSVTLDKEKCKGCINCIKRCPTEAIRVRNGKAYILSERCIDCGECIRVCPYHAKKAIVDSLDGLKNFKYNIVLPAPSLYAQFKKTSDINKILTGIKKLGFDSVFEVASAADIVTDATKKMIQDGSLKTPVIGSACPAIVKLIMVRFPNLIENILPIYAPMEISAMLARERAIKATGLDAHEIGVFFISPCPAKMTAAKANRNNEMMKINGVFSMSEIFVKIINIFNDLTEIEALSDSSYYGVNWASSGGEIFALNESNSISVDGISSVINILEQIEDDQLNDILFVEANACIGGCLGGALTVKNSYLAERYLKNILSDKCEKELINIDIDKIKIKEDIEYSPILRLDDDVEKAMEKLGKIDALTEELPGLDCGSCGAPSCRALAEDIIRDRAEIGDCIFKMREKVRILVQEMLELEGHLPPPFRVYVEENQNENK